MVKKSLAVFITFAIAVAVAAAADQPTSHGTLSAAQIADRNVAARGGLQAWRAVQTLSMTGKLGAGGNQRATLSVPLPTRSRNGMGLVVPQRPAEEAQLPFVMDLKRPNKLRFELQFNGQTAIQVFDGTNGWKLRPFLNRREVEPYTAEEMKQAQMRPEVDPPLVDYAAKGTRIELVGEDKVENRDTYKLKLTMSNGRQTHVWIDAKTFLEAKMEGAPRRMDGVEHPVEVYFRDYRPISGLQIPFVLETRVLPVAHTATGLRDTPVPPEKALIEKVVVNPKFDDALFSRAQVEVASNAKK